MYFLVICQTRLSSRISPIIVHKVEFILHCSLPLPPLSASRLLRASLLSLPSSISFWLGFVLLTLHETKFAAQQHAESWMTVGGIPGAQGEHYAMHERWQWSDLRRCASPVGLTLMSPRAPVAAALNQWLRMTRECSHAAHWRQIWRADFFMSKVCLYFFKTSKSLPRELQGKL